MASRFSRSKLLEEHAGVVLMTGAALLLLVSAFEAWAEDEPAARAPLPPLLRSAPAEAGERQKPDPAPNRNQPDPRPPAIRSDRLKSQLSQKKPRLQSASYLRASVAKKRETPARLGNHSMDTASHGQGHRTVASEKRQRRDQSPAEAAIGSLSTPGDYPDPRARPTTPAAEPRQAPPLYYPNYFAGPPAYGYAPSYPYAWAPPGPGVFR